jgi:hypothetical protein
MGERNTEMKCKVGDRVLLKYRFSDAIWNEGEVVEVQEDRVKVYIKDNGTYWLNQELIAKVLP